MITSNPFTTDNYMKAVDEMKAIIEKQADEIERLRERWKKVSAYADEIERLQKDFNTARDAHDRRLQEIARLREALKDFADAYDEAVPFRTANMHKLDCKCLRCSSDKARAALAGEKKDD